MFPAQPTAITAGERKVLEAIVEGGGGGPYAAAVVVHPRLSGSEGGA